MSNYVTLYGSYQNSKIKLIAKPAIIHQHDDMAVVRFHGPHVAPLVSCWGAWHNGTLVSPYMIVVKSLVHIGTYSVANDGTCAQLCDSLVRV